MRSVAAPPCRVSEPDSALGVEGEVEREHVHARLTHEAERAVVRVLVDELEHARELEPALPRDARRLESGVVGRDVGVEPRRPRPSRRPPAPSRPGGDAVQLAVGGDRSSTVVRSAGFVGPRFDAELAAPS